MLSRKKQQLILTFSLLMAAPFANAMEVKPGAPETGTRWVQVSATTKQDRTKIETLGVSIEATRSDSVWGFATDASLKRLRKAGIKVLSVHDFETGRGGHETLDFPGADSRFHNYAELTQELNAMATKHSDVARVVTIGKSLEERDIYAIHINTSPEALEKGESGKPGIIYMGNHHAREHLSLEIPLMLAQHLLENRKTDTQIASLLDGRDIWIIPMVNPDGAEYDISTGRYKMWRKNRRNNGGGTMGVDLNRNYGYMWGTGGSSTDSSSDVYMGKQPFSEPETRVIRDFVEAHLNAKILLTFHTFSELILYPWGHKYESVEEKRDLEVFETMARTMAQWNKYKPEQASDLYIASGDTTDWAYGAHKIFAFTFELSPSSMFDGGFYPGAGVIDRVFAANLKPALYLLDAADNPYKVLGNLRPHGFLQNYVEPSIPYEAFWAPHPI